MSVGSPISEHEMLVSLGYSGSDLTVVEVVHVRLSDNIMRKTINLCQNSAPSLVDRSIVLVCLPLRAIQVCIRVQFSGQLTSSTTTGHCDISDCNFF
jgi:hypothetical protein